MKFDPTKDYYGLDLSVEINSLNFNFWEFMKNLVVLASPAERQKEIFGPIADVVEEMALDFEFCFTFQYQRYLDKGLLTRDQVSELKVLDRFFEERGGEKMPAFWDNELLGSHPDWQEVRRMAQNILVSMKQEDLVIELTKRQYDYDSGDSLMTETTQIRLRRDTPANKT